MNTEPSYDEFDDGEFDPDEDCPTCGGEGTLYGEDLNDPLWYGVDELYPCRSCHGSGKRKDVTAL